MSAYWGAVSLMCLAVAGIIIARLVFVGGDAAKGKSTARARAKRLPLPRDEDRLDLSDIDEAALAEAAAAVNGSVGARMKRALDVIFASALLIGLAPMLALTALAIKIDSPGPILYRQKRVGRSGCEFQVFKFRSMVAGAENAGPQYAALKDARITRVGYIIRRLRIDEVPQTINVLRGEMSFVGPRPERPEFVKALSEEIPHYNVRHMVKPGITGWAQVKYEYAASVEGAREKLRYDLFYIAKYSPLMDFAIVALTVRVALFGLGSR